jgi:hypothetical protein
MHDARKRIVELRPLIEYLSAALEQSLRKCIAIEFSATHTIAIDKNQFPARQFYCQLYPLHRTDVVVQLHPAADRKQRRLLAHCSRLLFGNTALLFDMGATTLCLLLARALKCFGFRARLLFCQRCSFRQCFFFRLLTTLLLQQFTLPRFALASRTSIRTLHELQ